MGALFTIGWLILSFVVAGAGSKRKIGWGFSFFASLILSPLVGAFVVFTSETKAEIEHREQVAYLLSKISKGISPEEPQKITQTPRDGVGLDTPIDVQKLTFWQRIKYGV